MRTLIDRRGAAWTFAVIAGLVTGCGPEAGDQRPSVAVPAETIEVLATPAGVTRVVDMQPTGDGGVWVLNSQPPFFTVLDPSGNVQAEFGEQGGGPREFDRPVALVSGPGATEIWVYDWVRNALTEVSPDSRRVVSLPRDTIPVPTLVSFKGAGINPAAPWLERGDNGFLFARARTPHAESALHLWDADVLRISADGSQTVDLAVPLADWVDDPSTTYGSAMVLLPYPLWTACANGELGLYDPSTGALRRLSASGEEMSTVEVPHGDAVPMTPDLVFEMFFRQFAEDRPRSQVPDMEQMRQLTEDQNREFVQKSSEYFPEYSELHCDERGDFWFRRFDPTVGRLGLGPDWLRMSSEGAVTLVSLPPAFRVFRIQDGRMWGTLRDELGVESVAFLDVATVGSSRD